MVPRLENRSLDAGWLLAYASFSRCMKLGAYHTPTLDSPNLRMIDRLLYYRLTGRKAQGLPRSSPYEAVNQGMVSI